MFQINLNLIDLVSVFIVEYTKEKVTYKVIPQMVLSTERAHIQRDLTLSNPLPQTFREDANWAKYHAAC